MRSQIQKLSIFVALLSMLSCADESNAILFHAYAPEVSGIKFTNQLIESEDSNIVQYLYYYNGSGVAAADFNNDGYPDVLLGSNQQGIRLYMNDKRTGDPSFTDVTQTAGLSDIGGWTTGLSIADVNADGWPDIYVCQVNYKSLIGRNRLLIHQGLHGGIPLFEDHTERYGLNFKGLSTQAVFFDFDLDGDLDMYLLNHSVHSAEHYSNARIREQVDANGDKFYRNNDGYFEDLTVQAGIYTSPIGYGLGVSVSDINNDGYPDIYIGNDFHENDYLYLNNKDSTFTEVLRSAINHSSQFSMGTEIADINNDGLMDILSLDMMPEDIIIKKRSVPADNFEIYQFKSSFGYHFQIPRNNLQLQQYVDQDKIPVFSEIGNMLGIAETDWSWSGLLEDFNMDGHKDLFITNGIIRRPNDLDYLNYIANEVVQSQADDLEIISHMPSGAVSNYLYINQGALKFANESARIKDNRPGFSTGSAYADFDLDGDIDLIVNNINEPASLLLNQSKTSKSLRVELHGAGANTQAIGAKIMVYADTDLRVYEKYPVRGFMSCSADELTISLAGQVDSMFIRWPDGTFTQIVDYRDKNFVSYKQVRSESTRNMIESKKPLLVRSAKSIPFKHIENDFSDAVLEKLLPWYESTLGPALAVADVNGDGLEDLYVGGAKDQAGKLFTQTTSGEFLDAQISVFEKERFYEDVDALFFDADGDGDMDLYVVSGGNEALNDSPLLLDRLYKNDGFGHFERDEYALPLILQNGSSVAAGDYDNDGDIDLAVGSLVGFRSYGISQGAHILMNDGKGKFIEVTERLAPEIRDVGMIRDIEWADTDDDGDIDLILAGEWTPIIILENKRSHFKLSYIEGTVGLWSHISLTDLNADGRVDIIAGNFGCNHPYSRDGLGLLLGDFDDNKVLDPILYTKRNGQRHPIAGKDLLGSHMNYFKKLYPTYDAFARESLDEMLGPVIGKSLRQFEVQEFETSLFINHGKNSFVKESLNNTEQVAPILAGCAVDINMDGRKDIILGGNLYEVSPDIGRGDASYGHLLLGEDQGFTTIGHQSSGFVLQGAVRHIKNITIDRKMHFIVAMNNDSLQIWH